MWDDVDRWEWFEDCLLDCWGGDLVCDCGEGWDWVWVKGEGGKGVMCC